MAENHRAPSRAGCRSLPASSRAPSGGPWGGDYVNRYFEEVLGEIFGNCLEIFKSSDPVSHFDLMQSFEVAKRIWNYEKAKAMKLQVPQGLVDIVRQVRCGCFGVRVLRDVFIFNAS